MCLDDDHHDDDKVLKGGNNNIYVLCMVAKWQQIQTTSNKYPHLTIEFKKGFCV